MHDTLSVTQYILLLVLLFASHGVDLGVQLHPLALASRVAEMISSAFLGYCIGHLLPLHLAQTLFVIERREGLVNAPKFKLDVRFKELDLFSC